MAAAWQAESLRLRQVLEQRLKQQVCGTENSGSGIPIDWLRFWTPPSTRGGELTQYKIKKKIFQIFGIFCVTKLQGKVG